MPDDINDFEKKYEIIKSRDSSKDSSLFYGVRTTGIFCRSGCSSRLPKAENVVFFNTAGEALAAGFRPCKRCRPLSHLSDDKTDLCVRICRIMEESENEPSLKELAEKTAYSQGYIQRVFKAKMGISPKEYGSHLKAEKFRSELSRGSSISSSIYSAGYGSSSRVYENLDKILSMTPSQYRNYGEGIKFRMEIFPCSLGFVLTAFTEKGLAAVHLGDSREVVESEFTLRFKNADIQGFEDRDTRIVEAILRKIEDPSLKIDVPLDIHGTVFQKKVWNALKEIPSGETRSYSDIAQLIGRPGSVRAVANACGKNDIAVLIPCHRVVRKNGDRAGYRWGKERKAKLLERESS